MKMQQVELRNQQDVPIFERNRTMFTYNYSNSSYEVIAKLYRVAGS